MTVKEDPSRRRMLLHPKQKSEQAFLDVAKTFSSVSMRILKSLSQRRCRLLPEYYLCVESASSQQKTEHWALARAAAQGQVFLQYIMYFPRICFMGVGMLTELQPVPLNDWDEPWRRRFD